MELSLDTVAHIARLARLDLTPEEATRYQTELSAILSYVDRLQELDTTDVPPTSHITDTLASLRPDIVAAQPDEIRDALVAAFPESKAGLLSVPPVFSDYKS